MSSIHNINGRGFWKNLFKAVVAIATVAFPVQMGLAIAAWQLIKANIQPGEEGSSAGPTSGTGIDNFNPGSLQGIGNIDEPDEIFYNALMKELTPDQQAWLLTEAARQTGTPLEEVATINNEISPDKPVKAPTQTTNATPWKAIGVAAILLVLMIRNK